MFKVTKKSLFFYSSAFPMGINHRKLLQIPQVNSHFRVFQVCGNDCHYFSSQESLPPPPPAPPPPQPPQYFHVDKSKANLQISPIFTLLFCFLAGFLVLVCYLALLRKYHLNLNNLGRRNSPDSDQNEDFISENRGPEFLHPIWFINSVGLQQSVIDSIAIFKYKRDEGLTEGTECSVCLSEFEEDESLRLLPKCSHAFHIPCIDTWLRSHKNCPMCRAPVVLDTNIAHLSTTDGNLNGLSLREENSLGNNNNGELGNQLVGEYGGETSEMGIGGEKTSALAFPSEQENISEILDPRNCDGRVLSDLVDHSGKSQVEELQPVRRSISMDSISASMIHFAVSNVGPMEHEDTKKVAWQGNKSNSRKYGATKSSSFGRSAHKWSGSRPRSSQSQDSILPL